MFLFEMHRFLPFGERFKYLTLIQIFIVGLICLMTMSCGGNQQNDWKAFCTGEKKPGFDSLYISRKADTASVFVKKKKMNQDWCILVDMGMHSGLARMVIWDFKGDSILKRCLVGHGCGAYPWGTDRCKTNPVFSNEENSHCTSLGRYRIGERGPSQWGIGVKYGLHGLDSSNSNAFKRFVVLHGWDKMSDVEIYPEGSPEGWGCPTVSNEMMAWLDRQLKGNSSPVLLWIYR